MAIANLISTMTQSLSLTDWLIAFLLVMQVWDFTSTLYIIRHGGHELNPFLAHQINVFGLMPALILSKLLFVPVLLSIGYYLGAWNQPFGVAVLVALTGWYGYFVGYGNTRAVLEINRRSRS